MGVGEKKKEKQHLSRADYLYHALRSTKKMGNWGIRYTTLPMENGSCRVWSWSWLYHNPKQPTGAAIFGPHVTDCDYYFFLSWNPSVTSVCAAEGDIHDLIPDSFRSWQQNIQGMTLSNFFKVISCQWSLQRSHSLGICGGWKQTLFCRARDAWGSCNRQTECVSLHPLWHVLLAKMPHPPHLAKNKPGLLGSMTHAWWSLYPESIIHILEANVELYI